MIQAALELLAAQVPSLIPSDVPHDEALAYATNDTLQRYLRARKWNVKARVPTHQGTPVHSSHPSLLRMQPSCCRAALPGATAMDRTA